MSYLTSISTNDVILWPKRQFFDLFRSIRSDIWPFDPLNLVATKWRHVSKLMWDMAKKLLTFSTKTTESPDIYFLWTKTKLKWSKGHLSLQIENGKIMSFWPQRDVIHQNWGEVCHKNYFNIIYLITTESCHIYFLG